VDLGTSHLAGIVGKKNESGTVSVLAEEIEDPGGCIRRGNVYNVEETARRINRLVLKLQNKLSDKHPGFRIEKVYVGIGGQSLHSIDHSEVKTLPPDAVVSEDDLRALDEQCRAYRPELLDVLTVSAPEYYVDDKSAVRPAGIPGKRIEARYKLIVGRPSIRKFIASSIEHANVDLAGIIISPESLAETMLTPDEKELGCTLINFGAGITSVVIYKGGALAHLSVIPLGGRLITKDLTTLPLVEAEAERLKLTYGSALSNKDKDFASAQGKIESSGREIDPNEMNVIIEARAREIVENVYARVKTSGDIDSLGSRIILSGGASALKNLSEMVRLRFKQEVRYGAILNEKLAGNERLSGNPEYVTAISLLIQGTENCASIDVAPTPDPVVVVDEEEEEEDTQKGGRRGGSGGKKKKGNLLGKFVQDLFKED
jgi:cell division protein FtsA